MTKQWKDIKVGDVMKDGSIVTAVHRTNNEPCCVVNYGHNKNFTCSYNHILLVDIRNLPKKGKAELEKYCTFVPLEESYDISCESDLSDEEMLTVDKFFHNEPINIGVKHLGKVYQTDLYEFAFSPNKKVVNVITTVTKSEPQKVDKNTYWLSCTGIKYLMNKYPKSTLYCNGNTINSVKDAGNLPCFCITTDTGRYET